MCLQYNKIQYSCLLKILLTTAAQVWTVFLGRKQLFQNTRGNHFHMGRNVPKYINANTVIQKEEVSLISLGGELCITSRSMPNLQVTDKKNSVLCSTRNIGTSGLKRNNAPKVAIKSQYKDSSLSSLEGNVSYYKQIGKLSLILKQYARKVKLLERLSNSLKEL